MGTRLVGGGKKSSFLSSHRCPEVDLLPRHDSETPICPPATANAQVEYLDVSSSSRHAHQNDEDEEEDQGSVSDWSEEDLSLHFSPSVILPSDDEDSDSESSFECIDVTMETQVKGQQATCLKMVPKRQIQLKRRENADERQVMLKCGPAEVGGADGHVSANELFSPTSARRHALRQHSMPASFSGRSAPLSRSDGHSDTVTRGPVAGASQGVHFGDKSAPRRLQKSFSLDESKTKMASCIIKSVLSKKMLVEQNSSSANQMSPQCITKTSHGQNSAQQNHKPLVLRDLTQSTDQDRVRKEGAGKVSCPAGVATDVFKAPVHVVRDIRSSVKNTYSLSFTNNSRAPTTQLETHKQKPFKLIGQEDSPPPTYQQAVGAEGQDETKKASVVNSTSRGFVTKVAASFCQAQQRKESNSHPVAQHKGRSQPTISREKPREQSQLERARGLSHQTRTSNSQPHLSTSNQGSHEAVSAPGQSPILGVYPQPAPGSTRPILGSYFYTTHSLPVLSTTLHPHLGEVSYVQTPLNYIQTRPQLQNAAPPGPAIQLLQRCWSEENHDRATGTGFHQPDRSRINSAATQESNCNSSATTEQQSQQLWKLQRPPQPQQTWQPQEPQLQQPQQLLCGVQGSSPSQGGKGSLIDTTGSTAATGTLFRDPTLCHMMLDLKSGRFFYVDTPPLQQSKMLLDPETGQYFQVFVPATSSIQNTGLFAVRAANPTPVALNSTPTILSVMQFQQRMAVSSLYPPPYLPFTLQSSSDNYTHTAS